MTLEKIITICAYRDSMRIDKVWLPLGTEVIIPYEENCIREGIKVSHSYCPSCLQKELRKIDEYNFLEKSKEYLQNENH